MWGDSQMYRAIDMALLDSLPNSFISAAEHGSGVYDFLVFVDEIKPNSNVIIGPSLLHLHRPKDRDKNNLGISTWALSLMRENGYSEMEILTIVENNGKPRKMFSNRMATYEAADTIIHIKSIEAFEQQFSSVPEYFSEKARLSLLGFQKLIEKNCNIIILEFPLHPILHEIIDGNSVDSSYQQFNRDLLHLLGIEEEQLVVLSSGKNLMYDETHLNADGAFLVTKALEKIIQGKVPTLIRFELAENISD